ncbi:MAG: DUF4190 domain-containing protein [Lachnospiraceae bacterium]|nr:DUF4190 domain-containing protein [Lachnospiraceae bacterium]
MSDQKNWYDDDSEPVNNSNNNGNNAGESGSNNNGSNGTGNNGYTDYSGYNYGGPSYNSYNSSYYSPSSPQGTNPKFGGAAFGCGIASLATLFTGVFSIGLGALGIIFAALSRRRGKGYPARAKSGLVMSVIGLLVGAFITANSLVYVYSIMGTDEFYNEFNTTYQMLYGEELDRDEFDQMFNFFGKN